MDLSKLSDSDLQLVAKGQVNMLSNDGLNLLANPPQDSLATKVIRGAGDVAGGVISGLTDIGKTISRPVNAILDKASPLPNGLSHTQDMSNRLGGLMGSLFNTDSTAFKAGSLGGNIIGTFPVGGVLGSGIAKVLPRLGSAVTSGGMTLGGVAGKPLADLGIRAAGAGINGAATAGLIDPNSAAEGGLLSAALPVAGKGLGLLGGAIGSLKGINATPLLDSAINQYKLPLSLSDISNNGFVKGANSLINDIPIIGRIGQNHQADLQGAFNREIGKTFGAYGDSLTPEILAKAKTDLGSNYDKLWNGNKFVLDRQFANDATNIIHDAGQSLNPDQAKTLSNQFDNLLGKVNNNEVDGSFVNNWQSRLRIMADGKTGLEKQLINDLRQKTLDAFKRNINPDDAALLDKTNTQYKAYKTVEPLLNKAEAGVGGRDIGDVPAALLPNAVYSQYGNNIANSPFADLSAIGSKYLVDRTPKTGGSPRAMIQNSALGTMLGFGAYSSPLSGLLAVPAIAATSKGLNSPAIAKNLLNKALAKQTNLPPSMLQKLLNSPSLTQATGVLSAQ